MNLITALTLSLIAVIGGCKGLSMYLTEKAKEDSAAHYAAVAEKKDQALANACAKGQTGIVLYYKGVYCAVNKKV